MLFTANTEILEEEGGGREGGRGRDRDRGNKERMKR